MSKPLLDDLISEAQAYERYGHLLAGKELREARQAGKLPHYPLRKGAFYLPTDLEKYIADQRVDGECPKNANAPSSSGTTGSPESPDAPAGIDIGQTAEVVYAAERLAQKISKKPKSA